MYNIACGIPRNFAATVSTTVQEYAEILLLFSVAKFGTSLDLL